MRRLPASFLKSTSLNLTINISPTTPNKWVILSLASEQRFNYGIKSVQSSESVEIRRRKENTKEKSPTPTKDQYGATTERTLGKNPLIISA